MLFLQKSLFFQLFFCICPILLLLLSGCGTNSEPYTEQSFLLDTVVSVTCYRSADREAVAEALSICRDGEKIFSRTDPESELYRLNAEDDMTVSDDLLTVLDAALKLCRSSEGRFDITMGGVSALYSFSQEAPERPEEPALEEAMCHTGYEKIHIDGHRVWMDDPDTVIDLGAIAKGYIADRMKNLLISRGVKHAVISLGGNVLTLGSKPDGKQYTIGIQYPEKHSSRLVTAVEVSDLSVVTSGVYERFFEEDGITYHHILDTSTGKPLRNGLVAVSIIGPESMICDGLSTACFAMGAEDGLALIDSMDGYEAIFITDTLEEYRSAGFETMEHKEIAER